MNKSVWVILALGGACMGLLWYFSLNMLQTPQMRRYYVIRNTLVEERGLPEDSIHLAYGNGRIRGIRVDLPDLARTDPATLEEIAGRVFEIEGLIQEEIREKQKKDFNYPGNPSVAYFMETYFDDGKGLEIRLKKRDFRRRQEIREAIGGGGPVRKSMAEMLGVEPGPLDLTLVLEGEDPSKPEIGISLRLRPKESKGGLPDEAGLSAAAVFDKLRGKIQFYRFILSTEKGEKSFTARSKMYRDEARARRGTKQLRWEKVFVED